MVLSSPSPPLPTPNTILMFGPSNVGARFQHWFFLGGGWRREGAGEFNEEVTIKCPKDFWPGLQLMTTSHLLELKPPAVFVTKVAKQHVHDLISLCQPAIPLFGQSPAGLALFWTPLCNATLRSGGREEHLNA